VGRRPVDWKYNCAQNGLDGVAFTSDDCPDYNERAPYLNNLITQLGGTGVPSGYSEYPRSSNPSDSCNLNSSASTVELPAGNWFINCPSGLSVSNTFRTVDGNVVFAGPVNVGSQGTMEINQSANADGIVFFRSGGFTKGAQATVEMNQVFVYLGSGALDFGGGSGALTWTAPLGGNFRNLALWTNSTATQNLGGQANITLEGVLFAPFAEPFRFTGQGGDNQTSAQFIVRRLDVAGQGTLIMQPNPDRIVILPAWGAALIR
jgi:hypothetical protein